VIVETCNPFAGFYDSIKLSVQQMRICINNLVLEMIFRFDLPAPQWVAHQPKSRFAFTSTGKQKAATNLASRRIPLENLPLAGQGALNKTTSQASSAAGASSSAGQSISHGQSRQSWWHDLSDTDLRIICVQLSLRTNRTRDALQIEFITI